MELNTVDVYVIVTALASGYLGMIWSRRGWWNTNLKVIFIAMAAWGAFIALSSAGYIVQVSGG